MSTNNLINRAWNLIPGVVVWILWNDNNVRIFKNSVMLVDRLMEKRRHLITKMIHAMDIMPQEGNLSPKDQRIVQILNLKARTNPTGRNQTIKAMKQDKWGTPPFLAFKLNFNGMSKKNLGKARYNSAIKDHMGNIQLIYHGNLGNNTNNATELIALIKGITLVDHYKFLPLIVKEDSEIVIKMMRKLQKGTQVDKITPSWRLSATFKALPFKQSEELQISWPAP